MQGLILSQGAPPFKIQEPSSTPSAVVCVVHTPRERKRPRAQHQNRQHKRRGIEGAGRGLRIRRTTTLPDHVVRHAMNSRNGGMNCAKRHVGGCAIGRVHDLQGGIHSNRTEPSKEAQAHDNCYWPVRAQSIQCVMPPPRRALISARYASSPLQHHCSTKLPQASIFHLFQLIVFRADRHTA